MRLPTWQILELFRQHLEILVPDEKVQPGYPRACCGDSPQALLVGRKGLDGEGVDDVVLVADPFLHVDDASAAHAF